MSLEGGDVGLAGLIGGAGYARPAARATLGHGDWQPCAEGSGERPRAVGARAGLGEGEMARVRACVERLGRCGRGEGRGLAACRRQVGARA